MPPTVTLKDVAAEAGIHASAVSRVLRDKDQALRLSEKRRQEIKDVAERLGYRPNSAAAATVSGKFNSIALVCGTGAQTSTLPQSLLYPLADAFADRDTQLVITRLSDEALTDERRLPLFLRKNSCDGLLLNYTHHVPGGVREMLLRYRIPSIWLNVKQACDCVHPDDFAAGRTATRWLLERGHRRISYLNYSHRAPDGVDHYSVADRRAGYEAEMQEAGLTPHVIQMRRDLEPADRLVAVRELLQQDDRPTAMAGYGGEIDVACTAAMSLGLSVPDDLDLVRFSENMVTFGGVTLPTLRIPQKQLAKAAAAALRAKINQPAVQLDPVAVPFCDRIPIVSQLPPQPAPPRRVPVPKG